MYDYSKPFLLCVDDDPDILRQLGAFLGDRYNIVTAENGRLALQILASVKPSLILLDIMMPEMDGYEVCSRLQASEDTAWIPVIFVSALGEEQDRARAFAAGAVDYLVKPVNRHTVRELVERHQKTGQRWQMTKTLSHTPSQPFSGLDDSAHDEICAKLNLTGSEKDELMAAMDGDLYAVVTKLGLDHIDIAQCISEYKGVPFVWFIDPDSVKLGALPTPFSRANGVVVIHWQGEDRLVMSNPFDLGLMDSLSAVLEPHLLANIAVTDPGNISLFFEKEPAPYLADRIITLAAKKRTPEIRIEPQKQSYSVRFLGDDGSTELLSLEQSTGFKLIARFKVFAGLAALDIQTRDGLYAHPLGEKSCNLRISIVDTPHGESMVIRILDVS